MEWVRGSPEGVELRALCKGSFGGQERPHCEAGAERRNRPRKTKNCVALVLWVFEGVGRAVTGFC